MILTLEEAEYLLMFYEAEVIQWQKEKTNCQYFIKLGHKSEAHYKPRIERAENKINQSQHRISQILYYIQIIKTI